MKPLDKLDCSRLKVAGQVACLVAWICASSHNRLLARRQESSTLTLTMIQRNVQLCLACRTAGPVTVTLSRKELPCPDSSAGRYELDHMVQHNLQHATELRVATTCCNLSSRHRDRVAQAPWMRIIRRCRIFSRMSGAEDGC